MVDLRERRVDDLRRHEVGEDLLHPHVVEPPHRHQVAEPHVGGLVRDEAGAPELLVLRRRRIEQERRRRCRRSRRRAPCRRTGTTGPAGNRTCPNGYGDPRVALEPFERGGVQIEDRVAVARHLRGVGLAVQHPEPPSVRAPRSRSESARRRTRTDRSAAGGVSAKRMRLARALFLAARSPRRSPAPPIPWECRA